MTPLKFALSLWVMILGAAAKKGGSGSAVSVDEMRELLVSSMQTTISLTQLVEQQTKRISEITSFVDDSKVLIEQLKENLAASEERLAQKIEEVKESKREKDVMIVSGEEELRDSGCARVCAGTTPRGATDWVNYSTGGIYTDVDISKCGFVTIPTVTTAMEGSTSHWGTTGSSEIYSVTTNSFRIYIVTPGGRDGGANSMEWNMEWIAVGYTC